MAVVGPWQGSTPHARIEIEYSWAYNPGYTSAHIEGDVYLATDSNISDTTNTWDVWGGLGSASGGGVSYSWSGANRRAFCHIAGDVGFAGVDIGARVSSLEGPGATIEAVLHLPVGAMAPFLNNSGYYARDISPTSFATAGISANGNGGNLTNVAVQVSVNGADSGVIIYSEAGSFTDVAVGGLVRATNYWFRVRVANDTWGWGDFGGWVHFVTLQTPPGPITSDWGIRDISQTDAWTANLVAPDNGGSAIDFWVAWWNTVPADSGGVGVVGAQSPAGNIDVHLINLLPGTVWYVKVIPHNALGYGPWTVWKSFTTLPGVFVNVAGVWKNAVPYVNVFGVWKPAVRYVNVAGVWKQ